MSNTENETATYDSPKDAGKPPRGIVTRWLKEIDLSGRTEADWRKQGKAVLKRYRDEAQLEKGAQEGRKLGTRFNILRPNTRVMKAAVYQTVPKPDVRQRNKDRKDPLGKAVAEVTERAVTFCMDKYDLDGALRLAINDQLLPGRGVTRMRYEPQITNVPASGATAAYEQITWEKCCPKHVNWQDFRRGPGRTWDEVTWVAFRTRLTRDEAMKEIPEAKEILKTIELDCSVDMTEEDEKSVKDNPDLADVFKRLTVWEVHDKLKREKLFIAPSYKDRPLAVKPDDLHLEDFFDIPRPLYATEESDTLIPLEDFRAYADQAKELDNITGRIDAIVGGLKIRGLYDASLKTMSEVMRADDNTLIPTAEEISELFNEDGLDKRIWLMPIEKIAGILQYLYQHREETKQLVYEITGLSDIMRGSSKASETATAQSIKAQNGAISIQDRRESVKRYARDLVRLATEIICEHFQVETLKAMTGCDYPTEAEKQQIQQQMAMLQQQMAILFAEPDRSSQPMAGYEQLPVEQNAPPQGAPAGPPPEMVAQIEQMQQRLAMPSWEQIQEVMKSDALRSYRIDVETDETAFGDQQAEQQAVTELLTAATSFLTAMAPLVQGQIVPPEVAKSLLMLAVRRFKAGRDVEDAMDEIGNGPMPPPVDPNAGKLDLERERMTAEREDGNRAHQFEREKFDEEKQERVRQADFAREQFEHEKQTGADDIGLRRQEFDHSKQVAQNDDDFRNNEVAMKTFGPEFANSLKGALESVNQMAALIVQSNQQIAQMIAQQGQREGAMMKMLGESITQALTAPRKVERGKDGKIKAVVPVAPKANGSEARM